MKDKDNVAKPQQKKRRKYSGRLTPKEAKYVRGIVETGSQRAAYQQAYRTDDMAMQTIDNKASALSKKGVVRDELERIFSQNGLAMQEVMQVHHRNLTQDDNLAVSQRAVKDYYDVVVKQDTKDGNSTPQVAIFVKG